MTFRQNQFAFNFAVEKYVPDRIDVTPDAGGVHDERAVLQRVLERDRLYVMDRGYAKFALFNAIVKHDSSYVCRLRDNSVYEIAEERPLTDADRQVNVLRNGSAITSRCCCASPGKSAGTR